MNTVRIGIIGDFKPSEEAHLATNAALGMAADACGIEIGVRWLPTPSLLEPAAATVLAGHDALLASPGSPYASFEGMLAGIAFARRHDRVFLGTCGGFQYALLEFARNTLGIDDADTLENASGSRNFVIAPVACPMPDVPPGAPKLSGRLPVRLAPGSRLAGIYGAAEALEGHFCNFEVNPDYQPAIEAAGLRPVAFGPRGEWRAVELPGRRFFIATLFQPQRTSVATGEPHPVLVEFVKAAAEPVARTLVSAATTLMSSHGN